MSPDRDILLIPGFMLDAALWRDVEPELAPLGAVHHADLSQDASIAAMAARALRHAPPRFIVIGFSMGGYVAREIVAQAPERVQALILVATSARGDNAVQARRKAALQAQGPDSAFHGISTSAIQASLHPDHANRTDLIARVKEISERLGGAVFRRQSLLERQDGQAMLATIHCPTLVIAGEKDALRTHAEAEELHAGIAGSQLVTIKGTGHMIPLEAPQALADVIRGWAQKHLAQ